MRAKKDIMKYCSENAKNMALSSFGSPWVLRTPQLWLYIFSTRNMLSTVERTFNASRKLLVTL